MSRHTFAEAEVGRWADGRRTLRAADPRMAELIDSEPGLDPDKRLRTLEDDAARDELTAATHLYRSPRT